MRFRQGELTRPPRIESTSRCTAQSAEHSRRSLRGRTEAMRLHHKARDVQTIQYVDVTSLYPYVCKYFNFPIGHPVIHVGDSCQDMQAMLLKDGVMKCSILPPKRLYHPVLPFRCNKRLLFCPADPVPWNRTEPRTARTKRLPKGR